jgi:hypothetical protein
MLAKTEAEVVAFARIYGCAWHGRLLSEGCCECGMITFYGGLLPFATRSQRPENRS